MARVSVTFSKAVQPPNVIVADRDLPSFECRFQLFSIEFGHSSALTLPPRGTCPCSDNIAAACINKSASLTEVGEFCDALDACDWAIVILSRLLYQQHTDCRGELAGTYFNKAYILSEWKKPELARGWSIEGLNLYRRLVLQEGRLELQPELRQAEKLHNRLFEPAQQNEGGSIKRPQNEGGGVKRLLRRLIPHRSSNP